jgi:hypothetical protein
MVVVHMRVFIDGAPQHVTVMGIVDVRLSLLFRALLICPEYSWNGLLGDDID